MLNERFTILELFDLALRVPEVGAVNFNILHSALTSLVMELGLDYLKPKCPMDEMDELAAKLALKKSFQKDPNIKRRESLRPVTGLRERIKSLRADKLEGSSSSRKEVREDTTGKSEEEPSIGEAKSQDDVDTEDKSESTKFTLRSPQTSSSDKLKNQESDRDDIANKTSVALEAPTEQENQQVDKSSTEDLTETVEGVTKSATKRDSKTTLQNSQEDEKEDELVISEDETETKVTVDTSVNVENVTESKTPIPHLTKGETDAEKETEVCAVMEDMLIETSEPKAPAMDISEVLKEEVIERVASEAVKTLADVSINSDEVIQKMWKVIKVDKRLNAAEEGVNELSSVVDVMLLKVEKLENETAEMMNKTKNLLDGIDDYFRRIEALEETCVQLRTQIEDANEMTRTEVLRLEEIIELLRLSQEMHIKALKELEASLQELTEKAASKDELEELKSHMTEMLDSTTKELKKRILEVQDMIIPKEDFMELVSRVDTMEETKVSREELGRLLEPGFLENFISEHETLVRELEELKAEVICVEENLNALIKRLDEEILKSIENSFAEINATIDAMKEKLDTLDADDINDTFARLEEQIEMFAKDLEHIKAIQSKFEKEVKSTFKKISDVSSLLYKLESTKADKSKMYELLEMKADIEMLATKLDKSEFVAVITEVHENVERLTITVQINETAMKEGFVDVRHDLSFKMYTEDFIVGTEPIRNRIKAILYEQKKMKELILTNLFPDAPGVTKCFSCKRAANLAGPSKFQAFSVEETSSGINSKTGWSKTMSNDLLRESSQIKLPPIDMDSVPIPPEDKPRLKDIHQLPVLFASARPQVGLIREKRKRDIDNEVEAYFTSGKFVTVGGEYTKTFPQQRGLCFTTIELPEGKKSEVLLQGLDHKFYKGALYEQDAVEDEVTEDSHDASKDDARSSVVVLKNNLQTTQPTATLSVPKGRPKNVKSRIIPSRNHD